MNESYDREIDSDTQKYMAIMGNGKAIHFVDSRYQQYKDNTW